MTWKPEWDGGNVTTVMFLLEPTQEGTRLTLRHEGFASRAAALPRSRHAAGSGCLAGWQVMLARKRTLQGQNTFSLGLSRRGRIFRER